MYLPKWQQELPPLFCMWLGSEYSVAMHEIKSLFRALNDGMGARCTRGDDEIQSAV